MTGKNAASAKTTRFSAFLAAVAAMLIAVCLSPATAFAAGDDVAKTGTGTSDELSAQELALLDNGQSTILPLAPSDSSMEDAEISHMGYFTTGATYNDRLHYEPDDPYSVPETSENLFVVWKDTSISANSKYCFIIFADTGTYFLGSPVAYDFDMGEFNGVGYSLDATTYETDLVFYSPLTLADVLDEYLYLDRAIVGILPTMERVTASNVSGIEFPDPSAFSRSNPGNFLVVPLIYDASALPEDFDPADLDSLDMLYYMPCCASFMAVSSDECTVYSMVDGEFYRDGNLLKPGEVDTYLYIPAFDDHIGIASLWGDGSDIEESSVWKVPAGAPIEFRSWIDDDAYVATAAAIVTVDAPGVEQPITDIYNSSRRNFVDFNYTVPESDYTVKLTGLAPWPGEYGFLDVASSAWYHDDVAQAAMLDYIHGYNVWYFQPDNNIVRADITTILFNMSGWTTDTYRPPASAPVFPDVKANDYFYEPVEWAAANDIVTGFVQPTGAVYKPYDTATREQFMTMIYRYAQVLRGSNFTPLTPSQVNAELASFPDGNTISPWARDAVAWCVANEIVTGKIASDGTAWVKPMDNITRAEAAAIGVRLQPQALTAPVGK